MAEKFKLKSGREVSLESLSLDTRDELLDSLQYKHKKDGSVEVEIKHAVVTKWLREGLSGKMSSDEYIIELTFDERTEIYVKMQEDILLKEKKASSSK